MKSQIINVKYGSEGAKQVYDEMKQDNVYEDRELFAKNFKGYVFEYLIDGLMQELKNQGYRSIGRGRVMFEEACDWQAKFAINHIIACMKIRKVPKTVQFKIGNEVPKVE